MELVPVRHALALSVTAVDEPADPGPSDDRCALLADMCHGGVIDISPDLVLGRAGHGPPSASDDSSIHRIAASRTSRREVLTSNDAPHARRSVLPIELLDRG